MPTIPTPYNYYPALSNLISVDDLPDFLSFIKEQVQAVFDNIYYKNYCASQNTTGSSAFYSLDIVPRVRLEQELFGTGMNLVLNPDYDDSTISSFPITIFWQWEILRYIRNFKQSSFSGSPDAFFNLAIDILDFSKEQILAIAVGTFVIPEPGLSPFEQLIADINELYDSNIIIDENDENRYEQLVEAIEALNQNVFQTVFVLYLLTDNPSETLQNLKYFFFPFFGRDFEAYIKDLFIPKIAASLNDISLAIEFPLAWLKPVDSTKEKSMLHFKVGTVRFTTENGLEFEGENEISFDKSEIGNTGITLFFDRMKLDLSRTRNIPEATAAGYPDDFVGVFVESAEIGLPEKWFNQKENATLGIFGENLLLGTGGISGTFGLRATGQGGKPTNEAIPADTELEFYIGGEDSQFVIGFRSFDVTLQQGEFVSTNIKGSLTIPGFKNATGGVAKINISMSFDKDGNFQITGSEKVGIPIKIPDVLTFNIKSLSIGKATDKNGTDKFFISTSGTLDFSENAAISNVFEEPLEIDQFIVWQNGTIELKGLDGAFKLPKPKVLTLGPAKITVTAIHFGTDEREYKGIMRKYWYFGFDGGISINPGGIDARGDGVKIYFTVDNNSNRPLHVFFRIQSLAIDLIIPGSASPNSAAALINGYLSMKESADEPSTEYMGGISLSLPKLSLSASAGMRYNPSVPSFLIDVNLNLPTAIPLGPTGVGIYGFRGLLGQRYVASRQAAGVSDDGSWYEYYKAKISPDYREGIQVSKMAQKEGFSVGAGVSLATSFDGGKVFSAKVFVMLSLPEVLLIQGQGAILRERIGLDTTSDPPFSAMIAITNKSIESAFGANIKIPESGGGIAKVTGTAEMAFFFSNTGAWYVNIGRDMPESKRVRAEIFTLFNAYFYFMLSKRGIAAGAGANWNFNKKLGPLKISALAYLDVAGKISFKPVQLGGSIGLGAGASIGVWRIKLGIEIHAFLAAEAPKPLIISGAFSFKLKLPWPIRKLGGRYTLSFTWSIDTWRDTSEILLIDPYNNVRAINRLTGESFPVYYSNSANNAPSNIDSYIIPVDSFIDIEFLKGMGLMKNELMSKYGASGQGAYYNESIPPEKGKSKQVEHEFHLEDISILYKNNNSWNEYEMYKAIEPNSSDTDDITYPTPEEQERLEYGKWQCETPNKYNKLRIMAESSLSYITNFTSGPPVPPEYFGYSDTFLFCEKQHLQKRCIIFPTIGQIFEKDLCKSHQGIIIRGNGVVQPFSNPFNLQNALKFGQKIELFFPEAQASIDLKFNSNADKVKVKFFANVLLEETGFSNLPLTEYVEITEEIYTPSIDGQFKTVSYEHTMYNGLQVDKIVIESIVSVSGDGFLLTEHSQYLLQENRDMLSLEDAVLVYGDTQLFSICTMNIADYNFNKHIKTQHEIDLSNKAMSDAVTTFINPIWRPNTIYQIRVSTKDVLRSERDSQYTRNYYFYFKTAGPIGHFHKYKKQIVDGKVEYKYLSAYEKLREKGREDQFRLATLNPYIDYSRSYPNADGRLINAKPLFYKYPKLLMFYKHNTVHAMFNNFKKYGNNESIISELRVLIKNPTETVSSNPDEPTTAHVGKNNWKINPDPIITPEIRMINNLAKDGANCSGHKEMTPLAVVQEITTGELIPDTLYTAIFNAVYKAPEDIDEDPTLVHSYVFKTSQYANFKEQIQSYILEDETENENKTPKAIFDIEKAIDDNTISKASVLLSGSLPATDPLLNKYANVFDRLTDGILKLGVLFPAVTTEFNIIRNTKTGNNVIGIIVRNPEPFNDPKIPEKELTDTIQLSVGNTLTNNYKVIFSQDKTQAFISNAGLNIPTGIATFTFLYKQYGIFGIEDGKEKLGYKKEETIEVEFKI